MDLKKQRGYLEFVEHVAKVNIEYLEGRTSAETAMTAISAMIVKMSQNLNAYDATK